MQSILVTDYKLVSLLNYIYAHDAPRTLLCPGGLRGLQRRYLYLKMRLGIEASPWTLGSIQGGGAVEFMRRTQNDLQWKGRWSNPRNTAHYLQCPTRRMRNGPKQRWGSEESTDIRLQTVSAGAATRSHSRTT
eukprot:4220647-Amphidinium_carterae.2